MSERLQYACDEHGWCDYKPCPKCPAPSSFAAPHGSADPLNDQPWPLRDVVQKLCEAAEILLHEKNYDGHGHEQIAHALKVGREWGSPPNVLMSDGESEHG